MVKNPPASADDSGGGLWDGESGEGGAPVHTGGGRCGALLRAALAGCAVEALPLLLAGPGPPWATLVLPFQAGPAARDTSSTLSVSHLSPRPRRRPVDPGLTGSAQERSRYPS